MAGYHFIPNVKSQNQLLTHRSYNTILNGLAAGISIINKDMRISWVNRRMAQSFGSIKNLKGKHCYITYNHKKHICANCPSRQTFKTGKVCESIQVGFTKFGEKRYYYLNTAPIRDQDGQVVQVLELVQDITNKKRLEEKLDSAYKDVSRRLKTATKELDTIIRLSQSMISTLDMQKVLPLIVKNASLIMGTQACSVRLLNKPADTLLPGMSYGLNLDYLQNTPIRVGEGIAGLIALTKKPISVTDITHDKRVKYANYLVKMGIHSILGAPIIFNEQLLGVLVTYSYHRRQFSSEEVKLFLAFASQAAIAISNAQMHENLHRIYLDTIKSLVLAMEARYPYMKGHSTRVTRYAIKIARRMQLSSLEIEIIRYSGNIHDVGKIAIPDDILNKPGKLTASERAIIELHPVKGQEMLLPLKFLEKGIPIVRHHHERYDGRGYPDGLEKKQIPLGARILCTADSFDAMVSQRPYRPKLSLREAINELKVNSGTQFDPEVVKIFLEVLRK